MTASVATSGRAQRRYGAPNETGTLTTGAPSAWASGQAYVVDPTSGGVNLVTNASRLYQCRTDHTSSGANEPTTTSDTTQWKYLGDAPAANNTTSGSLIVAIHAGRNDPMSTPSDNDGGSFASIVNHSYSDFTQWGLGVYRRSTAATNKSGYTVSTTWEGTSVGSGAGEEVTLGWLELRNVLVGAPHTTAHVERASPTGGTVTGASYTLTTRCLVLSIWGGIGGVLSAGTSHTATPLGGIVSIPILNMTMALTLDGYIQVHAGWAIRDPGTYADQWTTTEGAQLFTLAWPLSEIGATGAIAFDDMVVAGTGRVMVTGTGAVIFEDMTISGSGIVASLAGGRGPRVGARVGSRVGN